MLCLDKREMRINRMSIGKKLLKFSGGISIFAGFIIAFVGFYFMCNGMSLNSVTPDTDEAVLRAMRYISAGGMYMMVFGIYSIYAGFRGLMNADDNEYIDKLKTLGMIYISLCILNIIIVFIISDTVTALNVAVCAIPLIISLIYITGVILKLKNIENS